MAYWCPLILSLRRCHGNIEVALPFDIWSMLNLHLTTLGTQTQSIIFKISFFLTLELKSSYVWQVTENLGFTFLTNIIYTFSLWGNDTFTFENFWDDYIQHHPHNPFFASIMEFNLSFHLLWPYSQNPRNLECLKEIISVFL